MYSVYTAAASSTAQSSAFSDDSEYSSLAAPFPRKSKCYIVVAHIIIGGFVQLMIHVLMTVISLLTSSILYKNTAYLGG